jgi:hypothetical protein
MVFRGRATGLTNCMPPFMSDFILNGFEANVYSLNGEMSVPGGFFIGITRKTVILGGTTSI